MKKSYAIALCLLPALTYANIVWPGMFLVERLFTWWAIGIGLVVEFFFVWRLFGFTPLRALWATVAANAVSALAGAILIPLALVGWYVPLGSFLHHELKIDTYWVATFILGCLVNALLEGAVYRKGFKVELRTKSTTFAWLVVANAFSVGAAFASLVLDPGNNRY